MVMDGQPDYFKRILKTKWDKQSHKQQLHKGPQKRKLIREKGQKKANITEKKETAKKTAEINKENLQKQKP